MNKHEWDWRRLNGRRWTQPRCKPWWERDPRTASFTVTKYTVSMMAPDGWSVIWFVATVDEGETIIDELMPVHKGTRELTVARDRLALMGYDVTVESEY